MKIGLDELVVIPKDLSEQKAAPYILFTTFGNFYVESYAVIPSAYSIEAYTAEGHTIMVPAQTSTVLPVEVVDVVPQRDAAAVKHAADHAAQEYQRELCPEPFKGQQEPSQEHAGRGRYL